jgi:two-component system, sensor histidine kinase and response regulator
MDGFTLAERINEDPALARATIMMLTSAGRRGDAARCRELGIAAYLHKPVRERDLLQAILLALSPNRTDAKDAELITRHTLREKRVGLRVLLAEDDLVNRQLAEHLLRNFGYQVTAVPNGRKALESIQASGHESFDIVLMDVQMPEMDGLEATAAIRALEQGTSAHLPIIAMTAHAMKGDRARFLDAGMDGYVAKPIQADQLLDVIEGTLPAAGKARPEHRPKPLPKPPIDWKRGLARLEGDSELFHDLLKLFAREAPATLERLRDAVDRKDVAAMERTAHTLKGSLGNFGAEDAIQAASQLEAIARNGRLEQTEDAARALEQEVGRVLAAIETPENEVRG